MTAIYFVCFHSEPRPPRGSRQYLAVETAIQSGEWPYDNGDDPSFYVARRGGPLTWGVCRQDVRNSIPKGSIVVFFSFTSGPASRVVYRLCSVATVADRVDHGALHRHARFGQFRHLYINGLIVPERGGWRHDETDRPRPHKDWLWRVADHRGIVQEKFNEKYAAIYEKGWFSDGVVPLADNYVVFAHQPDQTFISAAPPEVAVAIKGQHETWTNRKLHALTAGMAARWGRDYLRVANPSHRNVHRQIRFGMPPDEAARWRATLIAALHA